MKNFSDTTGNRTRVLMAGKAVPQPTTPQRTSKLCEVRMYYFKQQKIFVKKNTLHVE
jgi:hypothetical protein